MKTLKQIFTGLCMVLVTSAVWGQTTDSVDVKDYDIALDLSAGSPFKGDATLTLSLLRPCASIGLELVGTVDSVEVAGVRVSNPDLTALPTAGIAAGSDFTVRVWYTGRQNAESGGWGGFWFDANCHYNLGVGFEADPHSMGRSVFPCRDNFTDKATYTLRVKTKAGWTAECGGMLQSRTANADGTESSVWRIGQEVPTYLVSVSQAAWDKIEDSVVSQYGTYPLSIGHQGRSETNVRNAFAELDSVVPMFERRFGPYRWGRIGYIATAKGSMEHVNNIALDASLVASMSERAQSTIAHELGHAWFGNLVTCATSGDMWINEGGASFCSEVAMESVQGRAASDDYYQRNLESVLRTTHLTDHGYRPLHGMPHDYTYGSTTYEKGWMVWHSLRGYLGEEVFYNALNRLMASCAFGNIDAYGLRDSLSLYSGTDLTDFFDFHVFGKGFVDYHVTSTLGLAGCNPHSLNVMISQQGVGTDSVMRSIKVPITFFSANGDTAKMWFTTNDTALDVVFSLPFVATHFVLDYDKELSDAATVGEAHTQGGSLVSVPTAHAAFRSQAATDIYVEHHWGRPWGTLPEGTVRTARRYWALRGAWDREAAVEGRFRYVRRGYSSSNYPNLDNGFYAQSASRDSIVLLYRPERGEWQVLPYRLTGTANEGFVVADSLLPGEYTLAIIDTSAVGITAPRAAEANLFPNPLKRGEVLSVTTGQEAPYEVAIFDAEGRQVWAKKGVRDGEKLRPALGKGTYFVRIENKFISLQSKLIQL